MSDRICLRCDWSGATGADTCPRCGAPLFRASGSASQPERRSGRPESAPAGLRGDSPPPPVRRVTSWTGGGAIALVVVVALAAVWFVRSHTPAAPADPTDLHGYLIATVPEGTGARLWVWDLAAGTASPGPLLDAVPTALVTSYSVNPGWVGLTFSDPGGGQSAWVARFLESTDRPVEIAHGSLVTWASGGGYMSVVHDTPIVGCKRRIEVEKWYVTAREHDDRYAGIVCGSPVALGGDRLMPFLEIDRATRPEKTIYQVGDGYLIPQLTNRSLLSISSESDLLIANGADQLELFFRQVQPIPIESGGRPFTPTRVLTWSADASQAFVLGTGGDGTHGVYRIVVGPRPRPRNPDLILATADDDVQAAPTTDGDVFVSTGGAVSRLHDGLLLPLETPDGAPPPSGPILWIGALPNGAET